MGQFKKNSKNKTKQVAEEEKIEVDDETLLNNCSPDELDGLIDRLRLKFKDMPDLTPVNAETFAIWLDAKEKEKNAEKEAKAKKQMQKNENEDKLNLDAIDESLFLGMDDMDDMLDGMMEDTENSIVCKEYVYKCINMETQKITCLDADFNDIVFDLDASNKKLIKKIKKVIENGKKEKKDVMMTVSAMKNDDKTIQTVSGAHIA